MQIHTHVSCVTEDEIRLLFTQSEFTDASDVAVFMLECVGASERATERET